MFALDVSVKRLAILMGHSKSMGLSDVLPFHCNAVKCVNSALPTGSVPEKPPFACESFDRVLVDAPCSARGQRPLLLSLQESQFHSFPALQRTLLDKVL